MLRTHILRTAALATALLIASIAQAQSTVTAADLQRLEDRIADARTDLSRNTSSGVDVSRHEDELDDLADEVVYLKVKLRKGDVIPRSEYTELRDRIDSVAARARGDRGAGAPGSVDAASGTTGGTSSTGTEDSAPARRSVRRGEVPVGQELDVRLQTELNSDTAQIEDRFEATSVVDLSVDGEILIPAGSRLRGIVMAVDDADRLDRKARLSLSFDQITLDGRSYPLRASVVQAIEGGGYKEDAAKIGTAAGVGAIIGGILGGVKGALAGILIGGGGIVAATEGQDIVLPPGTVLRIRFDSPLVVR
jgi:hypothetical protein